MNAQLVHGGGVSPVITRRVFYTGADTLYEGYALCYNFDAADQTAEGLTRYADGSTISIADSLAPTPARRIQVEKPSLRNLCHFAGVVSNKSNGVTGPCWVEINLPGSTCNIYANADCDHEAADGYASGQILTVTNQSYAFKYTGLPGRGSAVILGDVDRSSAAGLVMAALMEGPESGGVQEIWNQGVANTVGEEMLGGTATSLGGSVALIPFGTIVVNLSAVGAVLTASAYGMTGSIGRNLPPGAKRVIRSVRAGGTAGTLTIAASLCSRLVGSVAPNALGRVDGTFGIASAANDCAVFEWSGQHWTLTALANSLNLYTT